jgi:hypothetical protein
MIERRVNGKRSIARSEYPNMTRIRDFCLVLLGLMAVGVGGCSLEPHYPQNAVVSDEGIVGTWVFGGDSRSQDAEQSWRVRIEPRRVAVADGRLRPDLSEGQTLGGGLPGIPLPSDMVDERPMVELTNGSSTDVTAYRIKLETDSGVQELGAFLLRIGDLRLLGLQWTGGAGDGLFLHPLHHLLKFERQGDRLTAWRPRYEIVWIPRAEPLDRPAMESSVPTLEDLESRHAQGGKMFVTYDIDRLLEVYRVLAPQAAFWDDNAMVATRLETFEGSARSGWLE